ncbi:Asp-tRNA(Asn)/Glu-tRNA(Gln) amidotransferase subunit GatC [Patescibacteria group bacterium]|nr:Asp-tRNA(Asn)/Glu-tRNA(Gln) amidotransferase subunit GatC [Patescibacteria group bacterium]
MLSKQEVEKVAKLVRIELTASEVSKMQKELSEILDYFNLLKKVPKFVKGQYPTSNVQHLRQDEAKSQEDEVAKKLIKAAPDTKENHIKVKAIF